MNPLDSGLDVELLGAESAEEVRESRARSQSAPLARAERGEPAHVRRPPGLPTALPTWSSTEGVEVPGSSLELEAEVGRGDEGGEFLMGGGEGRYGATPPEQMLTPPEFDEGLLSMPHRSGHGPGVRAHPRDRRHEEHHPPGDLHRPAARRGPQSTSPRWDTRAPTHHDPSPSEPFELGPAGDGEPYAFAPGVAPASEDPRARVQGDWGGEAGSYGGRAPGPGLSLGFGEPDLAAGGAGARDASPYAAPPPPTSRFDSPPPDSRRVTDVYPDGVGYAGGGAGAGAATRAPPSPRGSPPPDSPARRPASARTSHRSSSRRRERGPRATATPPPSRVVCLCVAEGFDRREAQDILLHVAGSLQAFPEVLAAVTRSRTGAGSEGWRAGGARARRRQPLVGASDSEASSDPSGRGDASSGSEGPDGSAGSSSDEGGKLREPGRGSRGALASDASDAPPSPEASPSSRRPVARRGASRPAAPLPSDLPDAFVFDYGAVVLWDVDEEAARHLVERVLAPTAGLNVLARDLRQEDSLTVVYDGSLGSRAKAPKGDAAPCGAPATVDTGREGTPGGADGPPTPPERALGGPAGELAAGLAAAAGAGALGERPTGADAVAEAIADSADLGYGTAPGPHALSAPPSAELPFPLPEAPCSPADGPRVEDDVLHLPARAAHDSRVRLAVSAALAASTRLSVLEDEVRGLSRRLTPITERLAVHGWLGHDAEETVMHAQGDLYLRSASLNLLHRVLGPPPALGDAPRRVRALHGALQGYLELDARAEVANDRIAVLKEMLSILCSQARNEHGDHLEIIVIWLVFICSLLAFVQLAGLLAWPYKGGHAATPGDLTAVADAAAAASSGRAAAAGAAAADQAATSVSRFLSDNLTSSREPAASLAQAASAIATAARQRNWFGPVVKISSALGAVGFLAYGRQR